MPLLLLSRQEGISEYNNDGRQPQAEVIMSEEMKRF